MRITFFLFVKEFSEQQKKIANWLILMLKIHVVPNDILMILYYCCNMYGETLVIVIVAWCLFCLLFAYIYRDCYKISFKPAVRIMFHFQEQGPARWFATTWFGTCTYRLKSVLESPCRIC